MCILHSIRFPYTATLSSNKVSLGHFNKQMLADARAADGCLLHQKTRKSKVHLDRALKLDSSFASLKLERKRATLLAPPSCSLSDNASSESNYPFLEPLKSLKLASVKDTLLQLTPFVIVKWSAILSVTFVISRRGWNLIFNPFFWMYFSWTWLFWPWFVAILLAVYGVYCFRRHLNGDANEVEQLAIVTSLFTWLTLVPPAHFNGYLEGWPYVFFFVYHYFFFFNVSVRKRLYGDLDARPHDPKWDINLPMRYRFLFCAGVMIGHWLAAFEGPELHRIPGGWSNLAIWILVVVTLLMHYNSTVYLAKYSEKVVVPTAVVQFGPYRWVRHPIYSSTMLLFATYCLALRAPFSLLFLLAVCLLYYKQKAKLEELVMAEAFGEMYMEYASKVSFSADKRQIDIENSKGFANGDQPGDDIFATKDTCTSTIMDKKFSPE